MLIQLCVFHGGVYVFLACLSSVLSLLQGENLNLVAGEGDVIVTIGVATCEVIQFSERNITCLLPPDQPASTIPDASFPEVNVS